MKTYYILSLKHGPVDGECLWWGPDNSGYTTNLNIAGLYSEEQVNANPKYYNDGIGTLAVAKSEVDRHAYEKRFCTSGSAFNFKATTPATKPPTQQD